MTGVVIATHGGFSNGLKESAEMIIGPCPNFTAISLNEGDSLEEFVEKIHDAVLEVRDDSDEVLIFVDLYGATPYNASIFNQKKFSESACKIKLIAGVNLPILLETLQMRESCSVDDMYEELVKLGKESIVGCF